jgi:hypothetical protein
MITVTWKEYESDDRLPTSMAKIVTHSKSFENDDEAKDFAVSVARSAASKEINFVPNSLEVSADFI